MVIEDKGGKGESGWTLVELVLTLMLTGLLAALAIPAFNQIGERIDRELTLDRLASDIRLAQREAESREAEAEIRVDPSETGYRLLREGETIRRTVIPARYRLKSNYPSGRLLFRPSGQARGGTFWLEWNGKRVGRVVVQVASGRPRVEVEP